MTKNPKFTSHLLSRQRKSISLNHFEKLGKHDAPYFRVLYATKQFFILSNDVGWLLTQNDVILLVLHYLMFYAI